MKRTTGIQFFLSLLLLSVGNPCISNPSSSVDQQISNSISLDIEDDLEDEIDSDIENDIEDSVEDSIEDQIEEEIEEELEEEIETEIEEDIEDGIEEDIEDELEGELEDEFESEFEDELEDELEGDVEDEFEEDLDDDRDDEWEKFSDDDDNESDEDERSYIPLSDEYNLQQIDDETARIVEDIEGEYRIANEWITLGNEETIESLQSIGISIERTLYLDELDEHLIFIADPDDTFESTIKTYLPNLIDSFDRNTIYFESEPSGSINPQERSSQPPAPSSNLQQWESYDNNIRVGIVDSAISTNHPLLMDAKVEILNLVPESQAPKNHGTAILSLFAGKSDDVLGLLPSANYFCASIFFKTRLGKNGSTVNNMVQAINWLIKHEVDVINLSVEGPDNKLLKRALNKATEKNIAIAAAAGNGGPNARPAYPAAYSDVIAVTAVNSEKEIYFLANQGDYIDFAAIGVNVKHAALEKNTDVSSGTSYATPIVAALLARLKYTHPEHESVELLKRLAKDIGPLGKDNTYGYGYVSFTQPFIPLNLQSDLQK